MWLNGLTEYGLYTKESEKDEKPLVSAFLFGLTAKIKIIGILCVNKCALKCQIFKLF